jgi:hypothetical protein
LSPPSPSTFAVVTVQLAALAPAAVKQASSTQSHGTYRKDVPHPSHGPAWETDSQSVLRCCKQAGFRSQKPSAFRADQAALRGVKAVVSRFETVQLWSSELLYNYNESSSTTTTRAPVQLRRELLTMMRHCTRCFRVRHGCSVPLCQQSGLTC